MGVPIGLIDHNVCDRRGVEVQTHRGAESPRGGGAGKARPVTRQSASVREGSLPPFQTSASIVPPLYRRPENTRARRSKRAWYC
jgi:hypothetical protein